jgi:hypothetical protein
MHYNNFNTTHLTVINIHRWNSHHPTAQMDKIPHSMAMLHPLTQVIHHNLPNIPNNSPGILHNSLDIPHNSPDIPPNNHRKNTAEATHLKTQDIHHKDKGIVNNLLVFRHIPVTQQSLSK